MSSYKDPCLQIAVSQRNDCNFLGAEVRRIDFIWGPSDYPHEEELGKVITCAGPLLITNLGIRHLWPICRPAKGRGNGLGLVAVLAAQPIKLLWERAFFRGEGGHPLWLPLRVLLQKLEGSFHLRRHLPATALK